MLVCTWVDYNILHANSATAAFTFLLLVLGFATHVGLRESIIASFGSMLAYNFWFLPPVGTLTIADPQNWVALFAFLATAITVSQLSSNARRKAEEAGAREQELRRMYNFSWALMLGETDRSFIAHAAQQLHKSFDFRNVSIYETASDSFYHLAKEEPSAPEELLRSVANSGRAPSATERQSSIVPILLGGHSSGSISVAPAGMLSEVALAAVAQLVAIALERARVQQIANLLEATRQNEQLKSMLLDALAHEFKTPLTSVKAATTTLLARQNGNPLEAELLTVIDEEADRMTNLVNDSLELARIGSGAVTLNRTVCAAGNLIDSALNELRPVFEGREIQLDVQPFLPLVDVDAKLSGLALRQVIGNALKYSPGGTPLRIGAKPFDSRSVAVSIGNEGRQISKPEQALLFEKFYRGAEARSRIPGTGLGLNITQEIIEAQGGRVWVESEPGKGVEFFLTLPVEAH